MCVCVCVCVCVLCCVTQLMANGVSGGHGVNVQQHVVMGNYSEEEFVTILHLLTMEETAQAIART